MSGKGQKDPQTPDTSDLSTWPWELLNQKPSQNRCQWNAMGPAAPDHTCSCLRARKHQHKKKFRDQIESQGLVLYSAHTWLSIKPPVALRTRADQGISMTHSLIKRAANSQMSKELDAGTHRWEDQCDPRRESRPFLTLHRFSLPATLTGQNANFVFCLPGKSYGKNYY